MGKFQDLKVWARAKNPAVSIPSNISEGDELCTNNQAINFFYFAKGSTAEVLTQAIIAQEIGYIKTEEFVHIDGECNAISSMLTKLIQARKK